MDRRKRIAVYGGTFDPVHFGHLAVARNVLELFEIDELLFVPARQAPHKVEREVTEPIHRYAMLVLATQDDTRLVVSTVELDAPERRYTVETLTHFKSVFGESAELFFVMGADSWAEISTWREWQKLVRLTNHIVVTRPGYDLESEDEAHGVSFPIDVRGLKAEQVSKMVDEASQPHVYITDAAMVDVSATDIRAAALAGREDDLKTMVPAPVADYILKYEIYTKSNEN